MLVEVLEVSEKSFSVITPLLKKKKADRVCFFVEMYLLTVGHQGFQSGWVENKKDGIWLLNFFFIFKEFRPELKNTLYFVFNQALKIV